jgi:hypothetical protein
MDREPALARVLVAILVVTRRVLGGSRSANNITPGIPECAHKDGDTDSAVRVDCMQRESSKIWTEGDD